MDLLRFLFDIGIRRGHNIIVHASFKSLSTLFPSITPEHFFSTLTSFITSKGSVILPAFTYNLKKKDGEKSFFHKSAPAKTGYISEAFRNFPGTIRTSSPTHSFTLWGRITTEIESSNNPSYPLGGSSPVGWMDQNVDSFALLIGTTFNSLTYLHYLERTFNIPYLDLFCWQDDYLPVGVSEEGEVNLEEVPGCSNGFEELETWLLEEQKLAKTVYGDVCIYYIRLSMLKSMSESFFKNSYKKLLCKNPYCICCNTRKNFLKDRGLI
ncbi:MAG: AAC(3) family N-acetyltransferase [Ignavibacteriaceae bacterium]|nr:AAC(3) family N-acetyltransferase [Ignavibacteriaceae bacterium]